MSDGDYVLGTRDDEIERLGIQHRVWRPRMLDAFARAGITAGSRVIDLGAGPGFATFDLADIVGPAGRVDAIERSAHFLAAIRRVREARGADWVEAHAADIVEQSFGVEQADASWCRWVLCFVSDPAAVLNHLANAMRPGGTAIVHEYVDYSAWRMMPPDALHRRFVDQVIASWRDSGGEPDIGLWLPGLLAQAGFELVSARVMADIVSPADFTWHWPKTFIESGPARLAELGYLEAEEAEAIAHLLDDAAAGMRMVTPAVGEFIARKM
jgi:SAM-dependent methyltransferase